MRVVLLSVALVFASCVTTKPAEKPQEDERTVCDADPSLKRIPKPSTNPQCDKRLEYADGCLNDNFDACYFAGTCVLADALGQPEATQKKLAHDAAPFFKTACTAGMAEACRLRAGSLAETGTPAKETCEDLVRASQLGDASAQLSCMGACLLD